MNIAITKQKEYYAAMAEKYDEMHLHESEHELALSLLTGVLNYYSFTSVLDVGAGTGRVIRHAKNLMPNISIVGVEPVKELREIGYRHGIKEDQLRDGDALSLDFPNDSFDIVCAFGILHHIGTPNDAIREMSRVARYGIFISDVNNFGCGSILQRIISQTLRSLRLWRAFQFVKTGGKMYKTSEGDGIHYSYSVFDSFPEIKKKFPQIHIMNTRGTAPNLYRGCSHIALLALRSAEQLDALNPHSAALHEGE
jgi:ubiquinone/menaquinone biosynthesis C-methylase UbiE